MELPNIFHPRALAAHTPDDSAAIREALSGFNEAHRMSAMHAVRARYCHHAPVSSPITSEEFAEIEEALVKMPTHFKLIRTSEQRVSVWRLAPKQLQTGNGGVIAVREWDDAGALLKSYPPAIALNPNIHTLEGIAWVACEPDGTEAESNKAQGANA